MSNEELVVLIQAGDRDRIVELWHQVRRMVYKQAARWAGLGGTTIEDLTQALSLCCGPWTATTRPEGRNSPHTCFNSKRSWFDPLQSAVSLDAPLTDDDDSDTFADLIPDPAAEAAIEGMDIRLGVAGVLAELPEEQRKAVYDKYWCDLQVDARTHAAAMKRLRHPDCSKRLRAYL